MKKSKVDTSALIKALELVREREDMGLDSFSRNVKPKVKQKFSLKKWVKNKFKQFKKWAKTKLVPKFVTIVINTVKIELEKRRLIKSFEKRYKIKHDRVQNLFSDIKIEDVDEKKRVMTSDLIKSAQAYHRGPSAPRNYDPLIVDIHNELCDEVNTLDLKTIIKNEEESGRKELITQESVDNMTNANGLPLMRNFTKNFKFKQAKDFHTKPKKVEPEILDNTGLKYKIIQNIEYYRFDLNQEEKDVLTEKVFNQIREREEQLKSVNKLNVLNERVELDIKDILMESIKNTKDKSPKK
jgi:hypothetical protein